MAKKKKFTTKTKARKEIVFEIDEEEYHFTPHKVASIMLPVLDHDDPPADDEDDDDGKLTMTQRTWDWLKAGLAEGEYQKIRARLEDEKDDLDVPDVAQIVRWLMSQVAGRPTGSRRS